MTQPQPNRFWMHVGMLRGGSYGTGAKPVYQLVVDTEGWLRPENWGETARLIEETDDPGQLRDIIRGLRGQLDNLLHSYPISDPGTSDLNDLVTRMNPKGDSQ